MRTAFWSLVSIAFIAPLSAAVASAQTPPAAAGSARLDVIITDVQPRSGELIVALYDSADRWFKIEAAAAQRRVQIDGPTASIAFDGLAPGDYAITVIHDENGNGKLDFRWFPLPRPTEGSGLSNNPTTFLGPPSFAQARFDLGATDQTVAIKMLY